MYFRRKLEHLLYVQLVFSPENRAFMMYMEKYCAAGQAAADNIIRLMRFALCITKATDTQSEYVILIAFALQQWLHERASLLHYTYMVCLLYYV
jgi:hypothetical protein